MRKMKTFDDSTSIRELRSSSAGDKPTAVGGGGNAFKEKLKLGNAWGCGIFLSKRGWASIRVTTV